MGGCQSILSILSLFSWGGSLLPSVCYADGRSPVAVIVSKAWCWDGTSNWFLQEVLPQVGED